MAVANNPYPQDVRVRQEAETLVAAGYAVTVIAVRGAGQPQRERFGGVEVRRYAAPPSIRGAIGYAIEFAYVTLATFALLHWVWLTRGLDVVHLHNPPDTLVVAAWLPRLAGKMLVFDHHDLAPELYMAKFARPRRAVVSALRTLERWSCRTAHLVITVNESYRRATLARHGVAPERVVVVRNAPPRARTAPVEADPSVRKGAEHVVGYLGHISAQDGVDHLIDALARLEPERGIASWHAVIVGPADDRAALDAQVVRLGLAARITFAGYRPEHEWRSMLAACDVCVVPDPPNPLNERSTMIKVMDYMALGRPVVAYDLPEHRVSAGDAARYARPGDVASLAHAIASVLQDPEGAARMGVIGRERIEATLAWEYSAERLIGAYDALERR